MATDIRPAKIENITTKKRLHFWLRLSSALIDISIIYCGSILLQTLIWKFTFVEFGDIFITTFLVYYFTSLLIFEGRTPAKILTGIKVMSTYDGNIHLKNIILREIVLKGIVGIILPIILLKYFFSVWSPLITMLIIVIMLLLSLILLLIFKRTWWELLSKTRIAKEGIIKRKIRKYTFVSIASLIIAVLIIILYPFVHTKSEFKKHFTSSFYPKYPVTKETKQYAEFISSHSQNPVDYIFSLFNKYDIVVLSERNHPEYSQYELISKIISDERFSKNIGNLFTEQGSVSFQDTLNTYLHTSFANEDELNKNTAILQRNSNAIWPLWSYTNLFDLFKTVNKLNTVLPESNMIHWYFTDIPANWETMTIENYRKGYTPLKRDSAMAMHIIQKYKDVISLQKRKKAFVIMNSNHGFGLLNGINKSGIKSVDSSTTNYLMKNLPGKVANVMINTISLKSGILFTPVQNGKWETAFSIVGNPSVGFDFKSSPLGDDEWDLFYQTSNSLTYKDIFTGFIFYKPLEEQYKKTGFPHEFDNYEDTLLRRASCLGNSEVEQDKKNIYFHNINPQEDIETESMLYAFFYNILNIIIIPFCLLSSFFMTLFFFVRQTKGSK